MSRILYLTTIEFAPGALATLPEALGELGIGRPLLISDLGIAAAGLLDRAAGFLPAGTPRFLDVPPNPTEAAVDAALAVYRGGNCDGVVAIGGGSPIDLAKGVALLATHPGPLETYAAIYGGMPKIGASVAPVVAIPTTAGTGAEVGRAALLTLADGRKLGFISPHLIPKRAICDPELTLGLPPGLTAATGLDALSHCIETFLSPRFNPPAEAIALDGAGRIWRNIERAASSGSDLDGAQRDDDGGAAGRAFVPERPRRGACAEPRARRAAGPEASSRHAERHPHADRAQLQRLAFRRQDRPPQGCDGAAGKRRSRRRARSAEPPARHSVRPRRRSA